LGQLALQVVELFLEFFVVQVGFGEIAVAQFDLLVEHSQFLVLFNQLGAENIPLIDDHIIILLLPNLLRLGLLYNLLQMPYMILLIPYHLLCRMHLRLCPGLIGLNLNILRAYLPKLPIMLNQILILILDFLPQLAHFRDHPVVFAFELADFAAGFVELFGVQVAVGTDGFVQVLLVFAFVLDILVVFL
jgi:hypothetical protein